MLGVIASSVNRVSGAVSNFPFSDDFNRVNGAPGSPPETTLMWESYPASNTMVVDTNGVINNTGAANGNLVVDYGTANQVAQAVMHGDTGGGNGGVVVNYLDQGNYVRAVHQDSDGHLYLQARVANSVSTWIDSAGHGSINGKTIRLEVLDNVYSLYEDDVLVGTYDDSAAPSFTTGGGHTKGGIHINGFINLRVDDYYGDIP